MICLNKWRRYLIWTIVCVVGALICGVCAEWQTVMSEKAVPVSAVSEVTAETDDYIELRIARDKNRSEARDLLAEAAEAETDDARRREKQDALWLADKNRQIESELETVIKARGFGDALVFCQSDTVTALVRTESLQHDEVTELAGLIMRISGVKEEHILIRAKP